MPPRKPHPDDDLDLLPPDDDDGEDDDDDDVDDSLDDLRDDEGADDEDDDFIDDQDISVLDDLVDETVDDETLPVDDEALVEDDWLDADDDETVEWDLPEVVLPWATTASLPELGVHLDCVLEPALERSVWEGPDADSHRRVLVDVGPVRVRVDVACTRAEVQRLRLGRDFLAGRVLVRVPPPSGGTPE